MAEARQRDTKASSNAATVLHASTTEPSHGTLGQTTWSGNRRRPSHRVRVAALLTLAPTTSPSQPAAPRPPRLGSIMRLPLRVLRFFCPPRATFREERE